MNLKHWIGRYAISLAADVSDSVWCIYSVDAHEGKLGQERLDDRRLGKVLAPSLPLGSQSQHQPFVRSYLDTGIRRTHIRSANTISCNETLEEAGTIIAVTRRRMSQRVTLSYTPPAPAVLIHR